ncbi:unnamed protein product [Spirodela intermedia]|uniref:Uncharacterized protein n=2 Tax=Spirodela intermedia TaxID=51605 RepID=A0A7I8JAB8_SPIIN|nr:unnamed protein product [Spirodela intermedia]CAA6667050.1 unnamed protein product [Spirodela intermedia]CAA7403864.1 unnamed protein product [Spirodela intermedia]
MESTKINSNIKLLMIALEGQEVGREKRLKDLHNSIDVRSISWLDNAELDAPKYSCDDRQVELQPCCIRGVPKARWVL